MKNREIKNIVRSKTTKSNLRRKLFDGFNKRSLISLLVIPFVAVLITGCNKTDHIPLKFEEITIEYGESISLNVSDYIDTDKIANKDDRNTLLKNISVTTDGKNETVTTKDKDGKEVTTEKEYPAVGEYTVKLTYTEDEEEFKDVKITVADTTAPVFNEDSFKNAIEITKDCNPKEGELAKKFKATDLSATTITVDETKVDYTKVGEYKAMVTATDSSENKTDKEVTIKVVEPTIKLDKTSETIYVKANTLLKATITGKDTKATFTSSNKAVATVNADGKVTGVKAGTATITAEANGVKATCKITVKKVPTTSKTTTKTVTNPNTGKKETVTVVEKKTTTDKNNNNNNNNSSKNNNNNNNSSNNNSNKTTSAKASNAKDAFNKINAERKKAGLPAYKWDSSLASYARMRAKECTVLYGHNRPNGEHILYSEILTGGGSASTAVNNWMNSAGHKAIILHKKRTRCAVAKIKDPVYGGYIWVGVMD